MKLMVKSGDIIVDLSLSSLVIENELHPSLIYKIMKYLAECKCVYIS
jgi:hypothetical protein